MIPFPLEATKFLTSSTNFWLGRMCPPILPMSALMILSVVFIALLLMMMEYWNKIILESWGFKRKKMLLYFSNPSFHHSMIPLFC
jgi:hypothetical protein